MREEVAINYAPPACYVWDAWFVPHGGLIHCFHLIWSEFRPGQDPKGRDWRWLGHAASSDLVNWETLPPALGPDENNPLDNGQPWTGCAISHQGRVYLYYTMHPEGCFLEQDRIGLALSEDTIHWHRYPSNPIITPDKTWYATLDGPVFGSQRCRDFSILPNPNGGWYGFYAARLNSLGDLAQINCVACVHSNDLIHWEHKPPAFVPDKYCATEVVDVFPLAGHYFLTLLAGHNYGNREIFSDPFVTTGTIYAVSDRLEGPYKELPHNVLLGANQFGPLSARTVEFADERYLLYTDHERSGGVDFGPGVLTGTLSTPKKLAFHNQRLQAMYSDRIEVRVVEELVGPKHPPSWLPGPWRPGFPEPINHWQDLTDGTIIGKIDSGLEGRIIAGTLDNGILEVNINISHGTAGLGFRLEQSGFWSGFGPTVVLDVERQVIEYQEESNFDMYREIRQVPLTRDTFIHLRVVLRGEHIEAYVDDALYLAFPRYRYLRGGFGLVVGRGMARFSNLRIRKLMVNVPRMIAEDG